MGIYHVSLYPNGTQSVGKVRFFTTLVQHLVMAASDAHDGFQTISGILKLQHPTVQEHACPCPDPKFRAVPKRSPAPRVSPHIISGQAKSLFISYQVTPITSQTHNQTNTWPWLFHSRGHNTKESLQTACTCKLTICFSRLQSSHRTNFSSTRTRSPSRWISFSMCRISTSVWLT